MTVQALTQLALLALMENQRSEKPERCSETRQAERLAKVRALVPLSGDTALLTECELELEVLLEQIRSSSLNRLPSNN